MASGMVHRLEGSRYIFVPERGVSVAKNVLYGVSWTESQVFLGTLDFFMPSQDDFRAFLRLLSSGEDVFDGDGNKVRQNEVTSLHRSILGVRGRESAEFLDARFEQRGEIMYINAGHHMVDGELQPRISEPLEDYLMGYHKRIDLEDWLRNPTRQGLPRTDVNCGHIQYSPPNDGSIAIFSAILGSVSLRYDGNPRDSDPHHGVRPCVRSA
ncbi:MAG TPA: hypothetical protein VJC07_02345 [Candidatus Nanoarchaeia archaeon]|nr:hypothetical protein [Candidatus Nanoarchaeia archaeon]